MSEGTQEIPVLVLCVICVVDSFYRLLRSIFRAKPVVFGPSPKKRFRTPNDPVCRHSNDARLGLFLLTTVGPGISS
jgi:hypothetical protein